MNNRQNGRRRGRGGQQTRNGQPGNPHSASRVDNRQRGNAAQLLEKYKTLARDSQMQGDRVTTEYYLQFADHYFRVLSENRSRFEEQRRPRDEFGQDYGTEEDGDQAARAYPVRDGVEEGWDDDADDGDMPQAPYQREPQYPREPQGREQQPREQNGRDRDHQGRDQQSREQNNRDQQPRDQQARDHQPRDAGNQGERRDRGGPRGDRRPSGDRRPNGNANGSPAANGPAATSSAGDALLGAAPARDTAPVAASAPAPESPRIELDRLPPALSPPAEPVAAADALEVPAPAPKPRRPRKPRAAPDSPAPVEA